MWTNTHLEKYWSKAFITYYILHINANKCLRRGVYCALPVMLYEKSSKTTSIVNPQKAVEPAKNYIGGGGKKGLNQP